MTLSDLDNSSVMYLPYIVYLLNGLQRLRTVERAGFSDRHQFLSRHFRKFYEALIVNIQLVLFEGSIFAPKRNLY